jgi:hypothetical protein
LQGAQKCGIWGILDLLTGTSRRKRNWLTFPWESHLIIHCKWKCKEEETKHPETLTPEPCVLFGV